MQISDRLQLGHLFNKMNFTGHGAEIGVQRGDFSSVIRNTWKKGNLHLIDRWSFEEDYIDVARLSYREQLNNYLYVVNRFAEDYSINIYRMDSVRASIHFPDGFFDWIYIDADHSYNGCRRDLETWYPKLKAGGIFCGHDYLDGLIPAGDFGVKSAVDEFAKEKGFKIYTTQEAEWKSWYFVNVPDFDGSSIELPDVDLKDELTSEETLVPQLLEIAEDLIEKGEYEKARTELGKILRIYPDNIDALNDTSVIMILENEFEKAEKTILRILELDSENEIALGNYSYLIENKK